MSIVPIALAGQTGGHRSKQFNSELTQNMYLDMSGDRQAAHDFPGMKVWAQKDGADRGWHVMSGALYKLVQNTLCKVDSDGTYRNLGAVSGFGRAVFADDGINLYFTANNRLYKYDGRTVATVSQSVVPNPHSIAYINTQFIIAGDSGVFGTSDPGNGDAYNALNFAAAEVAPDPLLRPYVFSQLVYMFGGRTTEIWYNSGVGNPPFARQDTSLVNVGIAGRHAVANTDQFLYWLGDDRKVYRAVGSSAQAVQTPSISYVIEKFSKVDDCICSAFVLQGQDFVLFKFPAADKALLYSETYGYWVELAQGTSMPAAGWYGSAVVRCYNKLLVSGGGDVLELDLDTFTDNTLTRLRVRTLPSFNGAMIGLSDRRITVSRVRINMQMGTGLVVGQGVDPVLICQFSPDGGETWQGEKLVHMGANGDYIGPIDFFDFCTGYDVKCRIMCSDPVYLSMFDGTVELAEAGY